MFDQIELANQVMPEIVSSFFQMKDICEAISVVLEKNSRRWIK